jgi:hypothetical protein
VKIGSMEATRTPRPSWSGLMLSPGPRRSWKSASSNVTEDALNPGVFTLAMLLPTTSIIV